MNIDSKKSLIFRLVIFGGNSIPDSANRFLQNSVRTIVSPIVRMRWSLPLTS